MRRTPALFVLAAAGILAGVGGYLWVRSFSSFESAPQTDPTGPRAVSLVGSLTPAETVAASAQGARGEEDTRPEDVSLRERRFPDAPVLDQRETILPDGTLQRVFLLQTSLKYPRVRLVETFETDAAGEPTRRIQEVAMAAGHLMIEPAEDASSEDFLNTLQANGYRVHPSRLGEGPLRLELPSSNLDDFERALAELADSVSLAYAEPDFVVFKQNIPNDPSYTNGTLWGLRNTGQSGGTVGVDIDAESGWAVRTDASPVIVGVIDTGVRYTHNDLAANMWTNPGEIPGNGQDDDNNGIVDDVFGFDARGNDGDPNDTDGHGTHCAGTVAAVGNNGLGVTGVAWTAQIMALRFLDTDGGFTSDAIEAITYARQMGADVLSNSWGGGGFSQSLYNAINAARFDGIVFVAAAGNDGRNNDSLPTYPASYDLSNIVSVAATDRNDNLAGFSNFGLTTVDLGAPGVSIYSTYFRNDNDYATLSGTSMATPHVAGIAALVAAENPGETAVQRIDRVVVNGVEAVASLAGKTVTGGRANLALALGQGLVAPGQIRMAQPGYSAGEEESNVTVTVRRVGGSTGAVSIEYETLPADATAGTDFTSVSGTLNWPNDDDSNRTVVIPILEDNDTEAVETFRFVLSNVQGGALLGSPSEATVSIIDNDADPAAPLEVDDAQRWDLQSSETVGGLAVVGNGTTYLAINGAGSPRLVAIGADGTFLWQRTLPIGTELEITAIDASSDTGDIVLVGFDDRGTNLEDAAIIRYSTSGTFTWAVFYSTTFDDQPQDDVPTDVIIGSDGSYYLTGNATEDGGGQETPFIVNISREADLNWSEFYNAFRAEFLALGETAAGDVIAVGSRENFITGRKQHLIARYSSTGSLLESVESGGSGTRRVTSVAGNRAGDLFVAGTIRGSTTTTGYLAQINPTNLSTTWSAQRSVPHDEPYVAVEINPADSPVLITSGNLLSSFDIAPYSIGGSALAAQTFTTGNPSGLAFAEWTDSGILYLAGTFTQALDIGGTAIPASNDGGDVVLISLVPESSALPGSFRFESDSYSVSEEIPRLDIIIERIDGTADEVTVEFSATSGTASAGDDFTPITSQVLTFGENELFQTVSIDILDDFLVETDETIVLSLANPSEGASLTAPQTSEVIIRNDDLPYDYWRSQKFSPAQLAEPLVSGEDADPEDDDRCNLAEYAFAREPLVFDPGDEITIVVPATTPGADFDITYTRPVDATDITYTPQKSSDFQNWIDATPITVSVQKSDLQTLSGDPVEEVVLGFTFDADRSFYRIQVERSVLIVNEEAEE